MDWSELSRNCKVKLECNENGVYEISVKSNNINVAVERASEELFYNYDGKKFISLEINRVIIFLDRFDNPKSSSFDILGRRYKNGSDIFLTKTITLGKINIDRWGDSQIFFTQVRPLLKCWISLVQRDKEISHNYQW